VFIKELTLKNFRCFPTLQLSFDAPIILIEGPNGCGKTSLLEALHYVGYLRSFRTHIPRELVSETQQSFFIKAVVQSELTETELQVGFAGRKRLVKLNQQAVQSFKELMAHYRTITLTEDDLNLIKGGPEMRRSFIDQALMLFNPDILPTFRMLRQVLDQRNALLSGHHFDRQSYDLWTGQLWELTEQVALERKQLLELLQVRVQAMEGGAGVLLRYESKASREELEDPTFMADEVRWRRSLFGAHLDDIAIQFHDRKSKTFASRGQQKLIVVLLKIALAQELQQRVGKAVLLMDDFMTDFDGPTAQRLLGQLTALETQLIITCPTPQGGVMEQLFVGQRVQKLLVGN
jgi:DNA replication and repair protein RecF